MKAYFETLGCRLNQSETGVIAKNLENRGVSAARTPAEADLIVVNTCTVTSQTDAKCRKTIRSLRRKNPEAKVAVVGCYAQTSPEEIEAMGGVDLILGNENKLDLAEFLPELAEGGGKANKVRRIKTRPFSLKPDAQKLTTTRANLKIQDGCDFMCAFCVIPRARGRSRSRNFANLLEEAAHLAASGVREVVLTGVNIGLYENEGKNFLSVLDGLERIPGLARVRISSIEPTTVGQEVFGRMADPASNLVPHLHLPLQASSDEVLAGMRRRYDLEYFEDFAAQAKSEVEDLCLGTDLIAGFPGETETLFAEGLERLSALPLNYLHIFPYSERKGTRSSRMADKINPKEINARVQKLKRLDGKKREAFYRKHAGKVMDALFETRGLDGRWSGLTENYLRVACESDEISKGEIHPVLLQECLGDRMLATPAPRPSAVPPNFTGQFQTLNRKSAS